MIQREIPTMVESECIVTTIENALPGGSAVIGLVDVRNQDVFIVNLLAFCSAHNH